MTRRRYVILRAVPLAIVTFFGVTLLFHDSTLGTIFGTGALVYVAVRVDQVIKHVRTMEDEQR